MADRVRISNVRSVSATRMAYDDDGFGFNHPHVRIPARPTERVRPLVDAHAVQQLGRRAWREASLTRLDRVRGARCVTTIGRSSAASRGISHIKIEKSASNSRDSATARFPSENRRNALAEADFAADRSSH